jgi:hypothetical protein
MAKDFTCPEKISIKPGTTEISELPPGFDVTTSPAPLRLSYASLYDGPPQDMGEQKPVKSSKMSATWVFEGEYPKGKWVSCEYGQGTVKLYAEVPEDAHSCTLAKQPETDRSNFQASFSCR